MLSRGIKRAQSIQRLINSLDKLIIVILAGNNFVNIALSAIVTGFCVFTFGYKWGIIIATIVSGFFIVVLCEITPKILAIKHTERVALFLAPFMEIVVKLFTPLTVLFTGVSDFIIKLLRVQPAKKSPLVTEEELRLMIELGKEEGFLSDDEGRMLQRIFEFGDIKVKDVMVPTEKMAGINISSTSEQLLNTFVEEGHARLPVFQGTLDNVVGIIYAHDLLYILKDKGLVVLQDLMHQPFFVQPKMSVNELLSKFQQDKIQIAIIANDQKKALGMVTLEDLLEEIVGEIEERPGIQRRKKN